MSDSERPSTCENPDADCYREPTRYVKWAEDFTAEVMHYRVWMCEPCAESVRRGTRISPNELEIRSVDTETDRQEAGSQ